MEKTTFTDTFLTGEYVTEGFTFIFNSEEVDALNTKCKDLVSFAPLSYFKKTTGKKGRNNTLRLIACNTVFPQLGSSLLEEVVFPEKVVVVKEKKEKVAKVDVPEGDFVYVLTGNRGRPKKVYIVDFSADMKLAPVSNNMDNIMKIGAEMARRTNPVVETPVVEPDTLEFDIEVSVPENKIDVPFWEEKNAPSA